MFRWLESQGAEVAVRSVTIYLLHKVWRRIWLSERQFMAKNGRTFAQWRAFLKKTIKWRILYASLVRKHHRFSRLLGRYAYPLPSMSRMLKQTEGLYDRAFFSGEGFMEIAEHVQSARRNEADMILSLKPFTCLPSVCSDAIQAKIEHLEQRSIFLPLEMSGDAIVNCRSRIQMKLDEARAKVEDELRDLAQQRRMTSQQLLDQLRVNLGVTALRIGRHVPGCTAVALAKEIKS